MPKAPSPGDVAPSRRRVRPPRAQADPRNWQFGAKFAYRPELTLRPSLAFSASSPEVIQTVTPGFAFGAHDWRLSTSSGQRFSLVERLPKTTPIPSRILQNSFGVKSLFVDESVMTTHFVALKLQTKKQLSYAEGLLQRRRGLLEEDRFQLGSALVHHGIVEASMQQKAAEEAAAEEAKKEQERQQQEHEDALRDARENARQFMEDAKRQANEAQAVYLNQHRVLEVALLEKKRLQQELEITQNLERGEARKRQVHLHNLVKSIESREVHKLPWAKPQTGGYHRKEVEAAHLVEAEEQRQKDRSALHVAKKVLAKDTRRLNNIGKELAQMTHQAETELHQVAENIASVDDHIESLAVRCAEAEQTLVFKIQAAEEAIRAHETLMDDMLAEEALEEFQAKKQAEEEEARLQAQRGSFIQGRASLKDAAESVEGESRRGSKGSVSSVTQERKNSKSKKVPVSVGFEDAFNEF